jgi:hypothetical protein
MFSLTLPPSQLKPWIHCRVYKGLTFAVWIHCTPFALFFVQLYKIFYHLLLVLPCGFCRSRFPNTKLYAFLVTPMHVTCSSNSSPLDLIILVISMSVDDLHLWRFILCNLYHRPVESTLKCFIIERMKKWADQDGLFPGNIKKISRKKKSDLGFIILMAIAVGGGGS